MSLFLWYRYLVIWNPYYKENFFRKKKTFVTSWKPKRGLPIPEGALQEDW